MLKLIFLGTSEATPSAKRNQTAIWLNYKNETLLIDCGEGVQRQLKIAGLSPCKLTRILITHWHGDHVLGLPGLIQTLALNNYSKQLHLYGPKGTTKFFSRLMSLFEPIKPLQVKINEIKQNGKILETPDFAIYAYYLKHSAPCLGYVFKEKTRRKILIEKIKKLGIPEGPLIGKLQRGKSIRFKGKLIKPNQVSYQIKGRHIGFILDTLPCKTCLLIAKDADLLITECTFSRQHADLAKERYHLSTQDLASILVKARPKKVYLLHVSQRYLNKETLIEKELEELLHAEMKKKKLKEKIEVKLASDFDQVIL